MQILIQYSYITARGFWCINNRQVAVSKATVDFQKQSLCQLEDFRRSESEHFPFKSLHQSKKLFVTISLIYIYIYIYREREREKSAAFYWQRFLLLIHKYQQTVDKFLYINLTTRRAFTSNKIHLCFNPLKREEGT